MAKNATLSSTQLIAAAAEHAGVSKADAKKVVQAYLDFVKGSVQSGTRVSIPGFGVFYEHVRPATRARTVTMFGEERRVPAKPAKSTAKFRPAKAFKDLL